MFRRIEIVLQSTRCVWPLPTENMQARVGLSQTLFERPALLGIPPWDCLTDHFIPVVYWVKVARPLRFTVRTVVLQELLSAPQLLLSWRSRSLDCRYYVCWPFCLSTARFLPAELQLSRFLQGELSIWFSLHWLSSYTL